MCEKRYWKHIRAYTIPEFGILRINFLRSDNFLVGIAMTTSLMTSEEIAAKFNEIEKYRSCKCELDKPCELHKEQK